MSNTNLRFNASFWCNLAVALKNVDQLYGKAADKANLSVLEWYILRALYAEDGQQASALARAVGRAPTSFTPILDKLQENGLIERKPHKEDRRALSIYLTQKALDMKDSIESEARLVEDYITSKMNASDIPGFRSGLIILIV